MKTGKTLPSPTNTKGPGNSVKSFWLAIIILMVAVLYLGWVAVAAFYNGKDLRARVNELELQVQGLQVEMSRRGQDKFGHGAMIAPGSIDEMESGDLTRRSR